MLFTYQSSLSKNGITPDQIMTLANKKDEGLRKLYVLGNNVWEKTAAIHCIEKEIKFLNAVDVVNDFTELSSVNDECLFVLIVFAISEDEVTILDDKNSIDLDISFRDSSRRFIKETNAMCRSLQTRFKRDVYRVVAVPNGNMTAHHVDLLGGQWHEGGLGEFYECSKYFS